MSCQVLGRKNLKLKAMKQHDGNYTAHHGYNQGQNETSNCDFYILSAMLYCKVSFHTVHRYIIHTYKSSQGKKLKYRVCFIGKTPSLSISFSCPCAYSEGFVSLPDSYQMSPSLTLYLQEKEHDGKAITPTLASDALSKW